MVKIETIQVGSAKSNCYIISNTSNDAIILDPGDCAEKISDYIESNKFKPLAIFATHAHYDHISAVSELKRKYSIPFYLHQSDLKLLTQVNMYRHFIAQEPLVEIPSVDVYLKNKYKISIENFNINVIHTGIHTSGHCCLIINEVLFTGDILYKGKLDKTINKRLVIKPYTEVLNLIFDLNKATKIYPGHGNNTTIAEELKSNNEITEFLKDECEYKANSL